MSVASIGVRTSNLTITQASLQIYTSASVKARLLEMSIIQATGTAQSLGLGRPQALAVTPATTALFQRDDSADPACVTLTALTFSTSPTVPLVFSRRWNSAATIGVGIVWTFPRGLIIPVSGALVVWNITTALASDINASIDE